MKIVQTLHWVQFAGTEKVCVELCNEISKQHEIYLLSDTKIGRYLNKNENLKLIEFDFEKNRYNPFFLYKTASVLKSIQPDIIHCHNTKELEIMYRAGIFLNRKIPLVITRHNAEFKKKNAYADLGVAVSEETMQYMNTKKSILITNGVTFKEPKRIELSDDFNILAVGRLAKVKGFSLLLKALAKVDFKFRLIILGEGDLKDGLQKLASELGISDRVEFKGFVDNVCDYVYSADLQVISSETEGLSISLIEAIFYAKILIASNVSNQADIIGKELVFDRDEDELAKKLMQIYNNYDEFKDLFLKVKDKKDEFGIEKMAQRYIEAYGRLLNL